MRSRLFFALIIIVSAAIHEAKAINLVRICDAYFIKGSGCTLALRNVCAPPLSAHISASDQGKGMAYLNGHILYKDASCTSTQEWYAK